MPTMAAISSHHYAPLQYPTYLAHITSHQRAPTALYTMADYQQHRQTLSRLAQSRSKADFFRHLGWDERDERHKRLYNLMKEEAAHARKTLTMDRSNLNNSAADDPRIQAPYSSSQMTETALFGEVRRIWDHASPETRQIYDLGAFQDQGSTDNWIIRWVLWHVFRYRDVRNRNRNNPARMVFDPVRDAHASNGSGPPYG